MTSIWRGSASALDLHTSNLSSARQTAPADRSDAFLLYVTPRIKIMSDDLQWIVQIRKGSASTKSSGWKSLSWLSRKHHLFNICPNEFMGQVIVHQWFSIYTSLILLYIHQAS
jgi:hypothetical protein